MKYYVVDAFTKQLFCGNPAGVCLVEAPLSDQVMQSIAEENNLSETAFLKKRDDGDYDLRWFTPKAEIDLCGHATLGTAYVVSHFVEKDAQLMRFHTMSGLLTVRRDGSMFEMDFPSRPVKAVMLDDEVDKALGMTPIETYASRDLLLLLENEEQVKNLAPDFAKLGALKVGTGVIVTAKGSDVDFVSRCFFPKVGHMRRSRHRIGALPSDPVLGRKAQKNQYGCKAGVPPRRNAVLQAGGGQGHYRRKRRAVFVRRY